MVTTVSNMTTLWLILVCCCFGLGSTSVLETLGIGSCNIPWRGASRIVRSCQTQHLTIYPAFDQTATTEDARAWLQETCSKVPDFLSCVTNSTVARYPTCPDVGGVIREAAEQVRFCDDSSWMRQYALPNLGTVEYACLGIQRTLCVDTVDIILYPDETTPLHVGMQMSRTNMGIFFDCVVREAKQKVTTLPGCSATWQQMVYMLFIHISTDSNFGIHFYPEQVQQMRAISTGALA